MDEEELEQPKKITIGNFFESIKSIDKVANRALKKSNSNLGIIQEQKSIINNLSVLIEGMQSDIQEINNYIIVEKNEKEDKLFEEQDKKQKEEMKERAEALKGEKGDQGDQGTQGEQSESSSPLSSITTKGGLGALFGSVGLLGAMKVMDFIKNPLGIGKNSKKKNKSEPSIPSGKTDIDVLIDKQKNKSEPNQPKKKKKNIFGFNQGGEVDSVPAMLTPGEFVVTKDAVKKVGVDTLKGLNASVGATNKPKLMEGTTDSYLGEHSIEFAGFNKGPVEKSMRMTDEGLEKTYFDGTTDIYELSDDNEYFHEKNEMIGSGMSSETIERYNINETQDDGTRDTLTGESRKKSMMVAVGVPDIIAHRNQLMSEINKLKGFEKVTFDQFMKKEHGIPQELLLPILYRSDASKATRKKMDRANKLDREQGVKPTSAYGNSLGYRQNQMNPATYVSSQDQLTERDVSTYKYDSAKDPTLAKGFSQGGLVTSKNIKPVIESNEKDLSSTIIQSLGANNQAIQVLNAQNQINNPVDMNQNSPALVQASKPNVSEANIKVTEAPIPFRKLLSSKKYLSVTSNSKSGLPPEIAKMLS